MLGIYTQFQYWDHPRSSHGRHVGIGMHVRCIIFTRMQRIQKVTKIVGTTGHELRAVHTHIHTYRHVQKGISLIKGT